jgi:hypothetical protein
MKGPVERGTNQLAHTRVEHRELAPIGKHFVSTMRATRAPACADDRAAGFEHDGQTDAAQLGDDRTGVIGGIDDRPSFVRDTKTATEIDMLQCEPVVAQLEGQRHERRGGASQRLERRDLRSNVDVHADEAQPFDRTARAVDGACLLQRHAELVRLEAR